VASGSQDKIIRIWNTTKINRMFTVRNLTGHFNVIQSLTNIDASRIASSCQDWKIKIWSVYSGKELRTLYGHSNWVMSLILLLNGNLACASADKTIRIWDLNIKKINS
jgi:WD40 repeat protein